VPEKGVGVRATAILHRTPWQPPVAVGGQGIYITLEDGREVIDAAGGAAVACIGNGHPVVREAIKEQVDKLACEWPSQFQSMGLRVARCLQTCTTCSYRTSLLKSWLES
jgi:adenosylmethionine-8-amino-7-oxononanoate aminotransferase